MSNIIKGNRIRKLGVLELSEHVNAPIPINGQANHYHETVAQHDLLEKQLEEKKLELKSVESLIQVKMNQANVKVEEMLVNGMNQAEKVKIEIESEKARIISEAYDEAERILEEAKLQVNGIIEAAEKEKLERLELVEEQVVDTLIVLLKHIISSEYECNTKWIQLAVRKMLLKEEVIEGAILQVSKVNFSKLENQKEQLINSNPKLAGIEINEVLNDTKCIIVCDKGNIEYDIEEGLEHVISDLRFLQKTT